MILPYCIVADSALPAPLTGVRGAVVQVLEYGELRCFYSSFDAHPGKFTGEDALHFHSVVSALFARAAVIPIRFPTLLESTRDLQQFMEEKNVAYHKALGRLRDQVQMELRIAQVTPVAVPPAATGGQYLKARMTARQALQAAADAARRATSAGSSEWRERETREGLRCYALVAREQVSDFQNAMRPLTVAEGVRVLVSGPWPATEFIE